MTRVCRHSGEESWVALFWVWPVCGGWHDSEDPWNHSLGFHPAEISRKTLSELPFVNSFCYTKRTIHADPRKAEYPQPSKSTAVFSSTAECGCCGCTQKRANPWRTVPHTDISQCLTWSYRGKCTRFSTFPMPLSHLGNVRKKWKYTNDLTVSSSLSPQVLSGKVYARRKCSPYLSCQLCLHSKYVCPCLMPSVVESCVKLSRCFLVKKN